MSSTAQKKAIKEFRAVTSVSEKIATDVLTANQYNLERALDGQKMKQRNRRTNYYSHKNKYSGSASSSSASSTSSKVDQKKLTALFDKYASEEDKDSIDGEQLQAFFTDLGLELSGSGPLAMAWQYKCKNFATVDRTEFMNYYSNVVGLDSLDKMKTDAKRVETTLTDKKVFKEFYRWLFDYVKEEEERKTIENNMAFGLWSTVLPQHFALTSEWVAFCKRPQTGLKQVSQDLWSQIWEFAKDVDKDLKNFDEDGAWPVVVDEFVAFQRKNQKA